MFYKKTSIKQSGEQEFRKGEDKYFFSYLQFTTF